MSQEGGHGRLFGGQRASSIVHRAARLCCWHPDFPPGNPPLLYSVHEIKEVLTSSLAPGVSVSLKPCQLQHPIYVPSDWSRGGHMTQGLGGDHGREVPSFLRSWGQAGVSWGLAITRGVPARDWIPRGGQLSKETEGTEI